MRLQRANNAAVFCDPPDSRHKPENLDTQVCYSTFDFSRRLSAHTCYHVAVAAVTDQPRHRAPLRWPPSWFSLPASHVAPLYTQVCETQPAICRSKRRCISGHRCPTRLSALPVATVTGTALRQGGYKSTVPRQRYDGEPTLICILTSTCQKIVATMPIHRETKGPGWHCLQKLSSLPSFMPLDDKTQKDILLRGLLSTAGMRPLNPAFGFVGYEPSSSHIDNIDCHDRLENLGSASFATILPQIQDKYGFKDVCDKVSVL